MPKVSFYGLSLWKLCGFPWPSTITEWIRLQTLLRVSESNFSLQNPDVITFLSLFPILQNVSWLEEKEKEVVSALRYFKTIVDKMAIDKKVLEMLPGSASKVLEAILPLVQTDPRIQQR